MTRSANPLRDTSNVASTVSLSTKNDETTKTMEIDETIQTTTDWKAEQKGLDVLFEKQAKDKLATVPKMKMPRLQNVKLFDHQVDGIRWLSFQEKAAMPSYWSQRYHEGWKKHYWHNSITNSKQDKTPKIVRGGILADDMGLGKTVQTVGLILANQPTTSDASICTLVACPVSVISNWTEQIKKYAPHLRVMVYAGNCREQLLQVVQCNNVDVMIVSYETLASDYGYATKSTKGDDESVGSGGSGVSSLGGMMNSLSVAPRPGQTGAIFSIPFFRFVLDEAHVVRSHNTKRFQAVCSIKTDRKLCLTGTPFVNSPDDIQSLLQFLEVDPLQKKAVFNEKITRPINDMKLVGLKRLRTVVAHHVLRRTSAQANAAISSEKKIVIHSIPARGSHAKVYDQVFDAARETYLLSREAGGQELARDCFTKLLRSRQSACDARLLPVEILKETGVSMKSLGRSPKVQEMIKIIGKMQPDEKGVIFSEWTSFLDLIGKELTAAGYSFTKIVGSMTAAERTHSMQVFEHDQGPRFILCSLKAAGVGINLVRANVVFSMTPWWNSAAEDQAADRVHRIGQTRDVTVHRLLIADSVEERMLQYQQSKAALGKGALEKLSDKELQAAKKTALADLFGVMDDDGACDWDAMDFDDFNDF